MQNCNLTRSDCGPLQPLQPLQQEQMSHLALPVPGFTAINGLFVAASVQLLCDGSQIQGTRPGSVQLVMWEARGRRNQVGKKKAEGH